MVAGHPEAVRWLPGGALGSASTMPSWPTAPATILHDLPDGSDEDCCRALLDTLLSGAARRGLRAAEGSLWSEASHAADVSSDTSIHSQWPLFAARAILLWACCWRVSEDDNEDKEEDEEEEEDEQLPHMLVGGWLYAARQLHCMALEPAAGALLLHLCLFIL